jgi:hypothetical protein
LASCTKRVIVFIAASVRGWDARSAHTPNSGNLGSGSASPVIHDDGAAPSKEKRLCEVLQHKYPTWSALAEKGIGGVAAMLTPLNLLLPRH